MEHACDDNSHRILEDNDNIWKLYPSMMNLNKRHRIKQDKLKHKNLYATKMLNDYPKESVVGWRVDKIINVAQMPAMLYAREILQVPCLSCSLTSSIKFFSCQS